MGSTEQTSIGGVNSDEYPLYAQDVVQIIEQYRKQIKENPAAKVQRGYLRQQLPTSPPQHPEPWKDVLKDVKKIFMKGVNKYSSPFFYAKYPLVGSPAAGLASMITEAVGINSSYWGSNPSSVELEMVVMDWMAKALGLPPHFLHGSTGGGVIVVSSSEGELMSMCAARNKKIQEVLSTDSTLTPHHVYPKLVVYSSQETHFNVNRACQLLMLRHHEVAVDKADNLAMTGSKLQRAMDEDRQSGLIPFFVVATLGTTSTCAFDNLSEIGPICSESACWLHVDAAYAGPAFLCPEFRHYLHGVEHVDSFCVNFYKWMKVGLGCCGFWLKHSSYLTSEFQQKGNLANAIIPENSNTPNFVHWQLHTCKNASSLQLWFVIRLHGITGLQQYIRHHVRLARYAADLLERDDRFSITHPPAMGLVCFKLKHQPDSVNQEYVESIQKDGRLYLMGSTDCDGFFLRFCVLAENITQKDIDVSIGILRELADSVLERGHGVMEVTRL